MSADNNPRQIKSVVRACNIIDELHRNGDLTITELDKQLLLSMGAIHTHLSTLKEQGYIIQTDKKYSLGPRLMSLGNHVRNNYPIYSAGTNIADDLAESSGLNTFLTVENRGFLYTVYQRVGDHPVAQRYYQQRQERPKRELHCTASGKAVLSQYSRERIENIVNQRGLDVKTESTISEREELFREMQETRERGYALADSESISGLRAISAPVEHPTGIIEGAITVSGPEEHITDELFYEELPELVTKSANTIEVNLQMNSQS